MSGVSLIGVLISAVAVSNWLANQCPTLISDGLTFTLQVSFVTATDSEMVAKPDPEADEELEVSNH